MLNQPNELVIQQLMSLDAKGLRSFASSSKQAQSIYTKNKEYLYFNKIFNDFECIKSFEDIYNFLSGERMPELCVKNKKYSNYVDFVYKKMEEALKLSNTISNVEKSLKIGIEILKTIKKHKRQFISIEGFSDIFNEFDDNLRRKYDSLNLNGHFNRTSTVALWEKYFTFQQDLFDDF